MDIEVKSPFPERALPRLWNWMQLFRSRVMDDFGPQTLDEFVDQFEQQQQKTWGLWRDGELSGMASFQDLGAGIGTGHAVFKKAAWGREFTMPALRAVMDEIFSGGIRRLTLNLLEGNRDMGALVVRLGGRREGTLREQTVQNGKPIDVWVYGLLKGDFYAAFGNRSGHLGDFVDSGSGVVQPQENRHDQQHADAIA